MGFNDNICAVTKNNKIYSYDMSVIQLDGVKNKGNIKFKKQSVECNNDILCMLDENKKMFCIENMSKDSIKVSDKQYKMISMDGSVICGIDMVDTINCYFIMIREQLDRSRKIEIEESGVIIPSVNYVDVSLKQIC